MISISVFCLAMAACAQLAVADWQKRIGHFSLDEAQQNLGAPESCVNLDHGGKACSWRASNRGTSDRLVLTFDGSGQLATADTVHFGSAE
jgi:hypothetical protein